MKSRETIESTSGRRAKDFFNLAIGSALGLGLSPIGPGTCGATLGVLLHLLIAIMLPPDVRRGALVVALILVGLANHILTPWAEDYWQSPDPQHFVLDEVAGYLLVPILFHHGQLWQVAVWGFLLFRVLDIIKISPASWIDRNVHGSWGIILDDLVSGGYAVLAMYGLMWIGPVLGLEDWLISG